MSSVAKLFRRTGLIAASSGAAILALTLQVYSASPNRTESTVPIPVIETVTFRLVSGVDAEQFAQAQTAVNRFLGAQPGFVSRTLIRSDEGLYLDSVKWLSQEQAEAAALKAQSEPALASFMQAIDPAGMDMRYNHVVTSFP